MTPLAGLGVWIWELLRCEGGNVQAIAKKARACGVTHVIVKAGEEQTNGQVTAELVDELRDGGIECAAWWYSRPRRLDLQVAQVHDLVTRCGVRHLVMDAESEWDTPDQRVAAKSLAVAIRQAIGDDVYFADAPWARPKSHGGFFPYAEFGSICNARSPQFYWEMAEAAGEPYERFIADCDRQWAELVEHTSPGQLVCPAGSPVDYTGSKHAPIGETWAFLDRYAERPSVSLWSWEHLNAAEWGLLAQRASARAGAELAAAQPITNPLAGVSPPLDIPGANDDDAE